MNKPLVSIIIPVYNAEKYLEETLLSAINQTWPNKEIIIVDDGSTDNSLSVAKKYENDWIKIFTQKNKGASATRNKGIAEAKGNYIQFLDADDLLSRNKIALQVTQLYGHTDKVSACPVVHFNNNQPDLEALKPNEYELRFYKESEEPLEFLLKLYGVENNHGGMIPVHSWLTPAKLIANVGQWDEKLTVNDDGDFFCRIVLSSAGIVIENNARCYYRKHTGSLSGRHDLQALESQYRAILLRKDHLNCFKNDNRINTVTARGLMELLMSTYPQYKKLSNDIILNLQKLPATPKLPIGGKNIEMIKKIFGWKIARLMQFYYTKLKLRVAK